MRHQLSTCSNFWHEKVNQVVFSILALRHTVERNGLNDYPSIIAKCYSLDVLRVASINVIFTLITLQNIQCCYGNQAEIHRNRKTLKKNAAKFFYIC